MAMLAVGLLAAQCLPLDLEGACILVGPQRPDQVVLPMHPYPHLAPPASPPCHPVVPATQDLMEDLPGPDPCIQAPLDGVQDFPDLVHNLVVGRDQGNMEDLLVDQDQDHMVHNTILDPGQTHGLDLKDQDQEPGPHTDQTK